MHKERKVFVLLVLCVLCDTLCALCVKKNDNLNCSVSAGDAGGGDAVGI
jgi:hypothetical protein